MASAVNAGNVPSMGRRVLLLLFALAAILLAVLLWPNSDIDEPDFVSSDEVESERQTSFDPSSHANDAAVTPQQAHERSAQSERASDPEAERRRALADVYRQRILNARTDRVAPAAEEESEDGIGFDPAYIRAAIESIRPLIAECYDLTLAAAEREGEEPPEGSIVAQFVIAGEPGVGAFIEENEIVEERSTLSHPALDECFRETLYTMELPAPEGGGRVTVHYPFRFRPHAEEPAP